MTFSCKLFHPFSFNIDIPLGSAQRMAALMELYDGIVRSSHSELRLHSCTMFASDPEDQGDQIIYTNQRREDRDCHQQCKNCRASDKMGGYSPSDFAHMTGTTWMNWINEYQAGHDVGLLSFKPGGMNEFQAGHDMGQNWFSSPEVTTQRIGPPDPNE